MIDEEATKDRLRRTYAELATRTPTRAGSTVPVGLEIRSQPRRRGSRRWAAAGIAASVSVFALGTVVWAARDKGDGQVSVADSSSSTSPRQTDGKPIATCPTISRAESIQRVVQYSGEVPATADMHAKLMTWEELRAAEEAAGPVDPVLQLTATTRVWAVEVVGTLQFPLRPPTTASNQQGRPWGVFAVNAANGAMYGPATGSGTAAPYWDALPDDSASCGP
jgi:hypothetical protein